MCGILGTTNQNLSSYQFNEALATINHRGPDNQSAYSDSNVIFGHTRLAIIDLDERSNQPFKYEDKERSILVVFNGEIYNYLILKKELLDKGYLFKTNSDTEVLCAAYLEWGISCFDHFEGMWAVSIFDNQKEQLIITRDRIGKKPFYYSYINHNVSFGSSLWGVSILANQFEISSQGLELYFALGFTPDTFSIIDGVHKLAPGKTIVFQKNQEKFTIAEERSSVFKNTSFKTNSVSKLFEEAILKRIISDVPIATLMSGGVDSTIVTAVTKKFHPATKTFFVDFDDKKLSEFYWADYLAQRNKIELNRIFLSAGDISKSFSVYDEVYEEPFADYSGIPSIAIFNKVAKEFKVVLTGDGGDELFYGYPHYFKKYVLFALLKCNKWIKIARFFPQNIKQVIQDSKENFESNYLKNHAVLTSFAASYINKRFNGTIEKTHSFVRGIIQYDRDFNNLPEKYLVKVDRASMFSGIEVRSPFLDEALIAKTKKIPVLFLFTPFSTKLYLKILYFRFFGMKYFLSKKKGFTPPIKELRLTFFKENNFNQLKEALQHINLELYNEVKEFTHEDLSKDSILFDRFFFFNLWYENYQKKVAQRKL